MPLLEDEVEDVLSKTQRARGLSTDAVAHAADLSADEVRDARSGKYRPQTLSALGRALGLNVEGLQLLADGAYAPPEVSVEGFRCLTSDAPMPSYPEMRVNTYLVFHPAHRKAVLFDTGTSLPLILEALAETGTTLATVFITHTHWDHIQALPALRKQFPDVRIYHPTGEPVEGGRPCPLLDPIEIAGLTIEARSTPGHSEDALTFRVSGLATPIAIVGDALFAGSIGGVSPERFPKALKAIEREILSLPAETLLCPGHGTVTTAAYERRWNPFSTIRPGAG